MKNIELVVPKTKNGNQTESTFLPEISKSQRTLSKGLMQTRYMSKKVYAEWFDRKKKSEFEKLKETTVKSSQSSMKFKVFDLCGESTDKKTHSQSGLKHINLDISRKGLQGYKFSVLNTNRSIVKNRYLRPFMY